MRNVSICLPMLCAVALAACGDAELVCDRAEAIDGARQISSGTVLSHGDRLNVGVSNVFIENYTGEQGRQERGPTAVLSLWITDDSTPPMTARVHAGQQLSFESYRLTVTEICFSPKEGPPGSSESYLRLAIETAT